MSHEGCPFCDGAIVNATFAETGGLRALYNLAPMLPGHALIVPMRHVTRLVDLTSAESSALASFAARVAGVVMREYGCTGYDLSLQEGTAAGQTLGHLHLHVIPRREGDLSGGNWHSTLIDSASRVRLSAEEMAVEVIRLRRAMANARQSNGAPVDDVHRGARVTAGLVLFRRELCVTEHGDHLD
ncbi:MAG: HIT family protein, partial [Anaerolineae bacterium]